MGKICYVHMVSLDGYLESPSETLDWVIIDEELHAFVNEQEHALTGYIYGGRMWEMMAAYWPTADQNPENPPYMIDYAKIWQSKPNLVIPRTGDQSTLDQASAGTRLVHGNVAAEAAKLKAQPGDWSVGGANPLNLRLLNARTFHSGVVFLHYSCRKGQ